MDIKRIDSWLVKGFDGITNLVIQRSQNPLPRSLLLRLQASLLNMETAVKQSRDIEPTLDSDIQLFELLLKLSHMLADRINADRGLDSSNMEQLNKYIATLKTAVERFYEQRSSSSKNLEQDHE